ncbi:MAG: DUF4422 domain-containing protein [Lachnospiraceae bacterium]|nr:DUF4422 domain-containing protein [Lachnospiraceae bacterium]
MDQNTNFSLYVIAHKSFNAPPFKLYVPIQVGAALNDDLGILRDDVGDNISTKNPNFCELTGMYWIWKNVKDKTVVGICHYRRYFINDKGFLLSENEIRDILSKKDIITSKMITLNNSYYYGFSVNHHAKDLDITRDVLSEKYPDYIPFFDELVNGPHTYFGNLIICEKTLYDNYMSWLFDILFEVERRVDMTGYDNYQKRLYGFLSEFLQTVYIKKNNLKVHECMIGMSGEKHETFTLRKSMENAFLAGDYMKAKSLFNEAFKKRNDLLMEASDVNGELKLCMQIISTCEYEAANNLTPILEKERDTDNLFAFFILLNRFLNEILWKTKDIHISYESFLNYVKMQPDNSFVANSRNVGKSRFITLLDEENFKIARLLAQR